VRKTPRRKTARKGPKRKISGPQEGGKRLKGGRRYLAKNHRDFNDEEGVYATFERATSAKREEIRAEGSLE